MTIENITALDYRIEDKKLTIVFTDTTLESILAVDGDSLTVRTNTGDTVEILNNYNLYDVTYDVATGRFVAVYEITEESNKIRSIKTEIESISEVLDALLMGDIEL